MMRTVVLKDPTSAEGQYLVTVLDTGNVTVAWRPEGTFAWGPPAFEVVADVGEVPTFAFVKSFGLIPELYTFTTEAEAQEAWNAEVDELLKDTDGFACTGDYDSCGDGACEEGRHSLEELYGSGFVTDWNDVELRKEW